jgi:hypothetical protein
MVQRSRLLLGSFAMALSLATLLPASRSALAHERREVGKYQLVVGFITEPALEGQPNGIDLRITDRETQQPVEGAEQTLKASIAFGGGQPREFPLRARFRMPGSYTADVIPTRSGSYVFTFSGQIEGQAINERFESGPGRFDDVKPTTELQFPVAEPTAAQLQQSLAEARQQASTASILAMTALAVSILALLAAGYLVLARRPARAMAPEGGQIG